MPFFTSQIGNPELESEEKPATTVITCKTIDNNPRLNAIEVTSATPINVKPNMPIAKVKMKRITKEKRHIFQFLASAILALLGMLFCHHVNGLFILVATTQFIKAMLKYAMPPPNSKDATDKQNKPNAPCFRPTKKADQTINKTPIKIATIPVTKKFGIKVNAISPTPPSNLMAGAIASI